MLGPDGSRITFDGPAMVGERMFLVRVHEPGSGFAYFLSPAHPLDPSQAIERVRQSLQKVQDKQPNKGTRYLLGALADGHVKADLLPCTEVFPVVDFDEPDDYCSEE